MKIIIINTEEMNFLRLCFAMISKLARFSICCGDWGSNRVIFSTFLIHES